MNMMLREMSERATQKVSQRDNPFGYAGYMYDKEIGMYYLIARYYNPDHGVFLSVDPDPGDEEWIYVW